MYKLYLAVKLHFTTDKYDIVTSRGRLKVSETAFNHRRDLHGINRLARKYNNDQVIEFFVANFASGDKWGGMFDQESETIYREWQSRIESLFYRYKQELTKLCEDVDDFSSIFDCSRGHPLILKAYLSGDVSIETLVILNTCLPFVDSVSIYLHNDIIWPGVARLIRKYEPFVRFDRHKYITITNKIVGQQSLT